MEKDEGYCPEYKTRNQSLDTLPSVERYGGGEVEKYAPGSNQSRLARVPAQSRRRCAARYEPVPGWFDRPQLHPSPTARCPRYRRVDRRADPDYGGAGLPNRDRFLLKSGR